MFSNIKAMTINNWDITPMKIDEWDIKSLLDQPKIEPKIKKNTLPNLPNEIWDIIYNYKEVLEKKDEENEEIKEDQEEFSTKLLTLCKMIKNKKSRKDINRFKWDQDIVNGIMDRDYKIMNDDEALIKLIVNSYEYNLGSNNGLNWLNKYKYLGQKCLNDDYNLTKTQKKHLINNVFGDLNNIDKYNDLYISYNIHNLH
tara:strand:- start:398 stop:994 length:597 start_codon:yes stop_codon:yes gene_type:complete